MVKECNNKVRRRIGTSLLGLIFLSMLVACGGGGNQGSGGSNGETPGNSSTSLVPPPPVVGAVLYAEAASLRPLRSKSEWTYRGYDRSGGTSDPIIYTSRVSQESSAGGILEKEYEKFNKHADATATIFVSNGTVYSTKEIDLLDTGNSETITMPELRSPVRKGDQYTLYERSFARSGLDIDNDKVEDTVDIAVYSVVVGNEEVQFSDKSTVLALRVNTTALMRFTRSTNGSYTSTTRLVESTWYASDIGVVRRSLTTPGITGSGAVDIDEVLVNWDGIVKGRGYTEPKQAYTPANAEINPGALLPAAVGIAGFDEHVMLVTRSTNRDDPGGVAISVMNNRGEVTSTREYPGLMNSTQYGRVDYMGVRFARLGNGAALLGLPANMYLNVRMFVFDAQGQLINGENGVVLPLQNEGVEYEVAYGGDKIWVLWHRRVIAPALTGDLVLRAFDAEGNAVTPEYVLQPGTEGALASSFHLSTDGNQVVATWLSTGFRNSSVRYAVIVSADAQPSVKTLASTSLYGLNINDETVRPIAGVGMGVILWKGQILIGPGSSSDPTFTSGIRGVQLDSALNPILSGTGTVTAEFIAGILSNDNLIPRAANLNGRLVLVNRVIEKKLYDDDYSAPGYNEVALFPNSTSAIATAIPKITKVPFDAGFATGPSALGAVQRIVAFRDRILLFGEGNRIVTALVWTQ